MSKCKNCCKEFKYQWCLDRHLRRKIPCKKIECKNTTNECNNISFENENCKNTANECKNTSFERVKTSDEYFKTEFNELKCKYCNNQFKRKENITKHYRVCKEKNDVVRCLEIKLGVQYPDSIEKYGCRFCLRTCTTSSNLNQHFKICKKKQEYCKYLEAKLKEKTTTPQPVNQTTNNIGTVNVLNVSAETLRKFGDETTDHITNAYLRQIMGRLGVTIPKVVSTVAKKIYCDNNKRENQTIQITNVRSQWAKVSNGTNYELLDLGNSVKGVRDKVTDLYVERQCDYFDYFKPVNARIDKLDDLNNQNYTARTLEDKEDQKNASKLKSQIDREIKSTLYNLQKNGSLCIK